MLVITETPDEFLHGRKTLTNESRNPKLNFETEPETQIVLPDGSTLERDDSNERKRQRDSEDQEYIPVIIKRTDETRRHPDDALDGAIDEGLEQLNRPAISLWLSAIAAGLTVGFSARRGRRGIDWIQRNTMD